MAGALLIGASRALLSGSGADTGFGFIAAADSVLGLSLGLKVVTAGDATLGAVPAAETGAGLALVRTAQFTAMSFGVAILGSVLSAAYHAGLAAVLIVSAVVVAVAAVPAAAFPPARAAAPQLAANKGIQKATVLVKGGYTPAVVVVEHGRPVRQHFDREESDPCSSVVVFGDFGMSATLPAGKMVTVDFRPDSPGEYPFTCPRGVLRGTLVAR